MKLDINCVRDVLLYLEENSTYENTIQLNDLHQTLSDYDDDIITYAVDKLAEANYINAKRAAFLDGSVEFLIFSISYEGHKFLDNVRDDNVWETTKKKINKVSSVSLDILSQVASSVITSLLMG